MISRKVYMNLRSLLFSLTKLSNCFRGHKVKLMIEPKKALLDEKKTTPMFNNGATRPFFSPELVFFSYPEREPHIKRIRGAKACVIAFHL